MGRVHSYWVMGLLEKIDCQNGVEILRTWAGLHVSLGHTLVSMDHSRVIHDRHGPIWIKIQFIDVGYGQLK